MIPCKDCLVMGVCRNKNYRQLIDDCSILSELLYRGAKGIVTARKKDFNRMIVELDEIMGTNHRSTLITISNEYVYGK